ncbi:MAG: uncharacterized protein A8A55_2541 [Amphiamblys sp. WSBS2006]|nr:MAG: uncharacterized protein A8A55_2922 [Amphiamblys sp. WSBS2006]OIR56709.1 MAG: uncharacterized protein A8A55_2541 [Amphiamblys sp. WSBS2006]
MKNWKAAGPDRVIPELLKVAAPDCPMRASIVKMSRRVWDEGILEKEWELAEVVTIPKKGDPEQVDNYRGISLLPVGLKMICTIAARCLNEYMEQNDILDERQAGFRRGEEEEDVRVFHRLLEGV